uniref:ornithine decarboxylase-like n=1 Tax=Styela clava TaxID=7725 RepID=UPI001939D728|nr:ornithine decarboxylase-like [Styela clava]
MKQLINHNNTNTVIEVIDNLDALEVSKVKSQAGANREDGEDAFFVCDIGDVVHKHIKWKKIFPRIHPFYAIKCNPSEPVLRCMIAMGMGFDCASKAEIKQMLELNADPKKIIFANPCKQSSHIKFARDNGVTDLVFDNEIELFKIKKLFPDANLVLRIQTDDSASICRFSMKYGAHADSCEALVDTAKKLELNLIGVSFHVGSGCQDPTAFVKALQLARRVFDYGSSIGFDMNLLDIGGGFPGTNDVQLPVEEIALIVNATLSDLFSVPQFENLKIIAEPGRYFAASAFTLATNVIAKRKVSRDRQTYEDETAAKDAILNAVLADRSDEPAFMYFLNDGLYGSFNCLFYDHAEVKPTLLKTAEKNALEFSSSVWGPTCDGLDRIIENCNLPELDIGDWIIWKDMGAYTVAAGSAFNGFKTSTIYFMISKDSLGRLNELCGNKKIPNLTFRVSELQEQDLTNQVVKTCHPDQSTYDLEFMFTN